ncbi:MAG: HAD family hydrolase [Acidimicrobiales bacterium]|nr:HAD family hydrolase [Acidimicrobiales bacterium]MCB1017001.1 HAD family hydrolase [Acidimicrobiales bacterium]MCB9373432.1 HAD family hydrolase [Microthrixaceae bacterium]
MAGPGVDAVVFDWGGTLSHFVPIELLDVWRAAAHHLDPAREDELTERLSQVEERFWARTTTTQQSATLADLLGEASRELGLDVAEAVLEEAAVRHLDAWTPHITHDPDAAPVLRALRERGLTIGLLSNTHWPRAFHEEFLERDGLAELIDARLYSSELSHLKPHPSVFRAALDALDVADPARAVFVGDRPLDDISGAQGVGMRAVLRPNGAVPGHDVEPDATIASLPELLVLVDAWS